MRPIIQTVSLSLTLTLGVTAALATGAAPASATEAAGKVGKAGMIDQKMAIEHLRKHQSYPATRAELLASCQDLKDFSASEKKWFAAHLPEGTYASADEVIAAVFKK